MRRYYNEVRSSLIFFLHLDSVTLSLCLVVLFFDWSVVCTVALPTHSEVFSSAASHVQIYYVFRIRFGKNTRVDASN
jgi:predicted membrane protein